ncbi:MAG: tetratricopeptide repeat protein, partial [Pseudomonadota bacterium]|nr:tetratricopeptide repeat protein [Pseudomonadota bacterium]
TFGICLDACGRSGNAAPKKYGRGTLRPSDPTVNRLLTGTAIACMLMGRYGDAVLHAEQARRKNEKFGPTHRILAAAYSQLGQTENSVQALSRYLELDPSITISHLQRQLPYQNAEQAEPIWGGLRKAGLPE